MYTYIKINEYLDNKEHIGRTNSMICEGNPICISKSLFS